MTTTTTPNVVEPDDTNRRTTTGGSSSYLKTDLQEKLHLDGPNKKPIDEDDDDDDDPTNSPGCGIIGRYPLTSLLIAAVLGIGVGIGLNYWEPENYEAKEELVRWIGLIGDLFIRALKCIVLPLVFVNVVLSTVEMMTMGKASNIGWLTIGVYLFTTLTASTFGVISTLLFKGLYQEEISSAIEASYPANMTLTCSDIEGTYLANLPDGNVECVSDNSGLNDNAFVFGIEELNNLGYLKESSGGRAPMGLSETFYRGIFHKLISSNIFASFVGGDLLAVVFFAIVFGVALGRMVLKKKRSKSQSRVTLFDLVKECDILFIQIIGWVILVTPFAVFSLITSRLAKNDDLSKTVSNIGYLFAASLVGMLFQLVVVHLCIFPAITKINPFRYLRHLSPAMAMAFASSSSAATLPVTLTCVESTRKVPTTVSNFVLPLGATINMDATAIYIPAACVWLAYLNGHTVNAAQYIILIMLGTVGSAGAAPVPSASLVLILSAYDTVFGGDGSIPYGFDFILAIDWLLDSFRTMLNVTGDAVVSALVTHFAGLDVKDDPLAKDLANEVNSEDTSEEQDETASVPENNGIKNNKIEDTTTTTPPLVPPAVQMTSFNRHGSGGGGQQRTSLATPTRDEVSEQFYP